MMSAIMLEGGEATALAAAEEEPAERQEDRCCCWLVGSMSMINLDG